jgi:L-aspartate oxidase
MGGVRTDLCGRSSLPGLYAAGEVACTGVHGANRLASNSLLEGLVFGARAGEAMMNDAAPGRVGAPAEPASVAVCAKERAAFIAHEVRTLVWEDAGIVRNGRALARALERVRRITLEAETGRVSRDGAEVFNLASVAQMVVRLALWREESRGAHWRSDYSRKRRSFRGDSCLMLGTRPRLAGRWTQRRRAGRSPTRARRAAGSRISG